MAGMLDQLLTGSILSGDSDKKAKGYVDQQTDAFNDIKTPTMTPEQLEHYQWLQDLHPSTINTGADVRFDPVTAAQSDAALAGPSAMEGVSSDPRLKDQQQASLGALQDLAARGGLNATDLANINKTQTQVADQDRGRRDAILQNMASRGMSGSGAEMLAQLSSSQAATDRASQAGLDVAGQAQQRALQAMLEGGQLAGQVRGQDFGEQAQKAAAADAIAKFNANQSQQSNQYNTGARNQVSEYNATTGVNTGLANRQTGIAGQEFNANATNSADRYNNAGRQGIANEGVDTTNRQNVYNTQQLPQTNFGNQMGLAAAKSGAAAAGTKYYGDQSDQSRQGFQNLAGGLIGAGTTGAKNYNKTGNVLGSTAAAAPEEVLAAHGGFVPGHASVPGDSPANDTVNAKLSPGEAVLPRSVTMSPHPMDAIKSFLAHPHSVQVPGQSPMKPEGLGDFLKALNPKRQANKAAWAQKEEDAGLGSRLAGLGLLTK